ncbi:MAG TPA: hypothetical protein VF158_14550 [Longimicrobiales bacterium]
MRSDIRHRHAWRLACLGAALVLAWLNLPLLTGREVPVWDADHAFASWYSLVADFARQGRLLLWNPWTNGGSPDFGEPQFGALSPLVLAYGFLAGGSLMAFNVYWLLVWFAGGAGMLVIARHFRAPAWGGFIAALAFLFSGFMTGHAEHTPFLVAFSALPWIVWRLDIALRERRRLPAVQAGAIWGLSALAGYPGMVMVTGGFAILWAAGRALIEDGEWRAARPRLAAAVGVIGLFALIGAVVVSPTYVGFLVEGRGYTDRAGALARDVAVTSNALHPGAVATFSSPLLSVLQWSTDLWAGTDISSSSVYIGVVATWLALFALFVRPRERWRWYVLAIGLVGLGLAMGRHLPLRGWLYDLFPPARYFRHAAIFRAYAIFAMLVLAIHGTRDLRALLRRRAAVTALATARGAPAPDRGWRRLQWIGIGVCFVAAAVYWSVAGPRLGLADRAGLHAFALAPWALLAVAALLVPRLRRGRRAVPVLLCGLAVIDAEVTAELAGLTIMTDDPEPLAAWRWVEEHRTSELRLASMHRIPYLPITGEHSNKHLGPKIPVLSAYTAAQHEIHQEWMQEEILVNAAVGHYRIWFVSERAAPVVPASAASFAAFRARTHTLGAMPAVIHSRESMMGTDRSDGTSPGGAAEAAAPPARRLGYTLLRYEPTALALRVTAPEPGYVIVTDRWARGWRARVDGVESPVLGANYLFRAIRVDEGAHVIEMWYRPFGLPWLLVASWGTLLLVAVFSLASRWSVRRPAGEAASARAGRALVGAGSA